MTSRTVTRLRSVSGRIRRMRSPRPSNDGTSTNCSARDQRMLSSTFVPTVRSTSIVRMTPRSSSAGGMRPAGDRRAAVGLWDEPHPDEARRCWPACGSRNAERKPNSTVTATSLSCSDTPTSSTSRAHALGLRDRRDPRQQQEHPQASVRPGAHQSANSVEVMRCSGPERRVADGGERRVGIDVTGARAVAQFAHRVLHVAVLLVRIGFPQVRVAAGAVRPVGRANARRQHPYWSCGSSCSRASRRDRRDTRRRSRAGTCWTTTPSPCGNGCSRSC